MSSAGSLELTDPVCDPQAGEGWFGRRFARLLRDRRDLPFLRLSALLTVLFVPLALWLLWPGQFSWWVAALYLAAYGWFLGPFILMLHNTCHRPLFRARYRWLSPVIPWVNGVLLGQSPETYYVHHIGMHHVENNLGGDLSSTLAYQRDSFRDFLRYYLRFLGSYPAMVRYFASRRRFRLLRRFLLGEAFFLGLTSVALWLDWRGALVVFVVPLFVTRLALMSGNWAQHAFVDPEAPDDDYRSVISFINSPYNHRCFNDGYHLGHHLRASRHWLEMPADFLDKQPEMIRRGSLVFEGTDYFQIFVLLMLGRWRALARRMVQLDPAQPQSEEARIDLLKSRVQRLTPAQIARATPLGHCGRTHSHA